MDPLVEIRRGVQAASNMWSNWKSVFLPKPAAVPKFYGPHTALKFERGEVESPLIYLVQGTLADAPDASLIEAGLPVSIKRPNQVKDLPYWPSYRGASPQQRAVYIDWLVGGRQDPSVPIGYVFIYFYGLERRVIAENADHAAIVAELLRLLPIYSKSRSFVGRATDLLWAAIWLGLNAGTVSQAELKSALLQTTDWSEEIRRLSLACCYLAKLPLSAKIAYRLTSYDRQAPQSVVVKREPDLHQLAFCKRFDASFLSGLELQVSKRTWPFQYCAASATLRRMGRDAGFRWPIPDVAGAPAQFRRLVEFWTQAIDELRLYDRRHSKAGDAQVTAEMFEALPPELRQGDHPHFDAWYQVLNRSVTEDGWTLIPAGELARVEGLPPRKKLTKSQSAQLAKTACFMGLAVEPDVRITGRPYAWDEIVSVFPLAEELPNDVTAYQGASVLLDLGVAIAAADGVIDENELRRITSHLESQFALSQQDSARLEHLRHLRTKHPTDNFSAARALRTHLTVEQRRLIGEYLVGIAAADERILPEEVDALRRAYRELGLESADLDSLLASVSVSPTAAQQPDRAGQEFRLDMTRINSIMAETAKVTEFLKAALVDDTEEEESALSKPSAEASTPQASVPLEGVPQAPVDPRFEGLSNRYVPFASIAIEQATWTRSALDTAARQQGLMLGAAVEAINEWAYEHLGDALLIEDNDQVLAQRELLHSKVS
jgi:uncharacterized tellurite resistance protein B-like protein